MRRITHVHDLGETPRSGAPEQGDMEQMAMRHRKTHARTLRRSLVGRSLVGLSVSLMAMVAVWPVAAQAPSPAIPQGSPLPRVAPPVLPSAAPGAELPLLPPPGAEVPNRPVKVTSTAIEGATVYSQAQLAQHTDGLIGPATPLPKIDAARQAILQQYRSQGFVLTTVSVKLDGSGALRFVVTEGRIAAVKLDGDIGAAGTQVLRFLNRLTETTPIDSKTLERYLLLAQDVPGVTVRAVLQPSTDRKSTRLNSSHPRLSRMPSSA